MSSNYKSLGIRRVINANATLTKLGGSLMPAEVRQAMQDAAQSFVDMHDLQQEVGTRLAEITRNEAAFVSCGAATGLLLATAACITKASGATYEASPILQELRMRSLFKGCTGILTTMLCSKQGPLWWKLGQ